MTGRTRKTPEQMIAGLERKLQAVKSKAKNMERAKQTRRAIIVGQIIQSMADSGDTDAKAAMAKVLAGLTRKQDRIAFDLEPLPETDEPPSAKPSAVALADRLSRAVAAWNDPAQEKTPQLRAEMVDAIVALEAATGELFPGIKPEGRRGFGLGDRPGERC